MSTSLVFTAEGDVVRDNGGAVDAGEVQVRARRHLIDVRFTGRSVAPVALTALLMWLSERRDSSVVISQTEVNVPLLLRDWGRIAWYISNLVECRSNRPRFRRQAITLARSPFATTFSAAIEVLRSDLEPAHRACLFEELFAGRFTLNTRDPDTGTWRAHTIGRAIAAFDPKFEALGVDRTYRGMTDVAYGAWVADTLAGHAARAEPAAESVRAEIHLPGEIRLAWYTRLFAPYEADGTRQFLVASVAEHADAAGRGGAILPAGTDDRITMALYAPPS